MGNGKKLRLPLNYDPRSYQLPILQAIDGGCKRAVLVWHRRSGKDKTCVNIVAKKMLERVGAYYYIFPTYNQGRKILWDGIDKDGKRFLDHFPKAILEGKPNDTEMKLRYKNGSLFQIVGSDNIDSIVGTNPVGVVFSEFSLQDPSAWGFVRPILAENGGWAIFVFTPRGENHGYDIYNLAKNSLDWFCQILRVGDTSAIAENVLIQEKSEIIQHFGNDALYQQEYECNFTVPIAGAYYAEQIIKLYADGKVGRVPHEEKFLVDTWWDLGINDKMSIWFTQSIGAELRVIDYVEGTGKGLNHYIAEMKAKPYIYGNHNAPHDIKVRELSSGNTRMEIASSLGINFQVVPNISIADGINAVRALFKKCWFDEEKCRDGLNALKNYRKQFDEKRKTYLDHPYHDWSSNACLVGETKLLTRCGTYRIRDLPKTGEILTPCGWKTYENPRITKADAQLVEVVFKDGYTVKCTPDHLFLTENGWIYAEHLTRDLSIQSSLTPSRNILMAAFTGLGLVKDTLQEAVNYFIEMFGNLHSEIFQLARTYTTRMGILKTINLQILNASQNTSIFQKKWSQGTREDCQEFQTKQEMPQKSGIAQKQEDCGTVVTQKDQKDGLNGSGRKSLASSARLKLWRWLGMGRSIKNIVPSFARPRIIESVRKLSECAEVWCLTVPDGAWYSLENGAVVHNSDAFRMIGVGLNFEFSVKNGQPELVKKSGQAESWVHPRYRHSVAA